MQHAAVRASERIGMDLSRDELLEIARKIRDGRAVKLSRDDRWVVTWRARAFRVVFRPDFEDPMSVVTVLPWYGIEKRKRHVKRQPRFHVVEDDEP